MGALILNRRRRNQSLFDEPGGLNREEIYAAGKDAADGSVYWESRFDGWWKHRGGKEQSNLTYSDARKAFGEGFKAGNADQEEEPAGLDKWDIRQEGARRADAAEADHWGKLDRERWGHYHFKIWWDGFGKRESALGPMESKNEFLRGWMATHDDRRDNPDDSQHQRYYAQLAADDAWQAELKRVYGRAAGDARYDKRGTATPKLAELHRRFQEARSDNRGIARTFTIPLASARSNPDKSLIGIQQEYIDTVTAGAARWGHRKGIPHVAHGIGGHYGRILHGARVKAEKELRRLGFTKQADIDYIIQQARDMADLERYSEE